MNGITFDFGDGNGPVPAHRNQHGGGWIADTATVPESAWVGSDACVYGNVVIEGDKAIIGGNARIHS